MTDILNLSAIKGDLFDEDIEVLDYDDLPFDFSGYGAKMQVRKNANGPVFLTFNTEDESIVLTEGNVRLFNTSIDLEPSSYVYDFKITSESGIETIFRGAFNVTETITT